MSEIILTVDTPVLKGEKGDKGETGVFDYTYLEDIVDEHLNDRFQGVEDKLNEKVDKFPEKDLVDKNVIKTFAGLEQWNDNKPDGENEVLRQVTEDRTLVKELGRKIDSQDLDNKMEEAKGEFQTYIDEKLVTAGSGDMLKSVYDKDDDGVVDLAKHADNASTVNGKTVETSVPKNAVFTDTTYKDASVTEAGLMGVNDKIKLNGIASGATRVEVVDDLDSTDTSKALSANQGKVLNDNTINIQNELNTKIESIENNINSRPYILAATATNIGDFVITAAYKPLVLNQMTTNSNSIYEKGSYGIKVKEAGYYLVSGQIHFERGLTAGAVACGFLYIGSTVYMALYQVISYTKNCQLTMLPTLIYVPENTEVYFKYKVDNGAGRLESTGTCLTLQKA